MLDSVVRQLDAEAWKVVIKNRPADHITPQASDLPSLKDQALSRQVAAHTIISQLFACNIVGILGGQRSGVFDTSLDGPWLEYARGLAKTTEEALEAQCFNNASVKQRFFYADVVKNAIAKEVVDKAQQRDGADANDLHFLLAMQEEAQAAKQAVKDSHHTYEGMRIPLDPHLEHLAHSLYDEILAQVKEELKELHMRQSRRGNVAGKRGAEIVQDKGIGIIEQQPPAKKRGRPAGSKNKPKAPEASQSAVTVGGNLPRQHATQQTEAQHPVSVHQLDNSIPQPQAANPRTSETPVVNEETATKSLEPKSDLKATSTSPTIATDPLADSTLQSLDDQHSLQQAPPANTKHVRFAEDVIEAAAGSLESAHPMPQASVHDEAAVSGEASAPSYVPMDKGMKRARDEEDDVGNEQPSPKSPRLDVPNFDLRETSLLAQSTTPDTPQAGPETLEQGPQELQGQYETPYLGEQNDLTVEETLEPSDIIWDDFDQHYGEEATRNFSFTAVLNDPDENYGFDSGVPWTTEGVLADGYVLETENLDSHIPNTFGPDFANDEMGNIE